MFVFLFSISNLQFNYSNDYSIYQVEPSDWFLKWVLIEFLWNPKSYIYKINCVFLPGVKNFNLVNS